MNGEAISEILGEMTGETVVNAKGIFEPEKIKRANQYLKDILESTNLDEYLKNMDNSEFQQLVMEHYFTVTDMQKIADRLNSNSKNSSEKDTGWSKKGFIWGRTEIVIPKLLINKKEEIKVIKNVGTEGIALVLSDEASSRDLLISPSHFQEIFKKFLERSIKEEMSVETWKIIRKRLAELKEKAVINDEFIDQIQPTLEQIKQSIKTQNADFNNNIKRIKELLNLSIITPKDIIDETPDEVIHDMLKSSSRMFKGWSDYEILQLIDKKDIKTHEYKQLLDGRNMNIVKVIENATREKTIQNFGPIEMYNFNAGIENSKFLMRLLNKIPRQYIENISDDLMDIYLNSFNSLTTISLINQDILKLLKEGIIDEKRIVDLYEQQQSNTSEYIDDIDNQEFLEFLTIDRMVNIVNDQNLTQRFKKMYNNLINQQSKDENEQRWKNVLDKYMQSEKSQEEKEKEIAKLISERILPIHILDEDTILNLAESRQLPYDLLVEEFMQGNISRNMIETVISSQEIPELSAKSLRDLYIEEIISIENLKNLDDEKVQELRRELIEIILPEDEEKRNHYISKLNNAYMEDIIDFETLTRMKDNGILSEEEYAKMRELYDEKIALKKLKEIEYIVCETEAEQREKREKGSPENETPTRDSGYKKYIINEFGGETTTEEYIKPIYGGNLDKYYMIIKPKARIVILESPIHGNATYILPLKVALEFVQTKNKKDLKGTFGVEHLNHSKNWKINLEERARKVQKSIGVQVKPNVVWLDEGDEPR
jgi:AraC-like DNA-binding protein